MTLAGKRIAYLALQQTREGQASHAHVHEIVRRLRDAGATVDLFEPSPSHRRRGVLARLIGFFRIERTLIRSLDAYDVLYVRGHPLAWPVSRVAMRRGIPTVQECNGITQDFFIAWPSARPLRPLIHRWSHDQFTWADAVVAGSEGLARWLGHEMGVEVVHVIPNGANVDLFRPRPRPEGIDLPADYAIFFGSLSPWQGIETTLAAVAHPDWPESLSLVIAGDGHLRGEVEHAASSDPRIVLLGTLPYEEIGAVVANAVVSLVNKEERAFAAGGISPLKLYESMAAGVPVVATESMPGLTDVVESVGAGIIVAQHDVGALARVVASLAANRTAAQEMGERGRAFVLSEGSWEHRGRQAVELIESVLERRA